MKKRIVCYGDSNTWGYISGSGERYDESVRWPCRLQQMLGSDYIIAEEGLTGRTTVFDDPLDPYLNGIKYMPPALLTGAPIDLLIFMLGTNDFQSHISGNNPIATARGVQTMLEEARKLNVGRDGKTLRILLISPIEITEDRLTFKDNDLTDEKSIENSRLLGPLLKIVAEQTGCAFIDAAKHIRPSSVDGVHMNQDGHAAMAELIYPEVKKILP